MTSIARLIQKSHASTARLVGVCGGYGVSKNVTLSNLKDVNPPVIRIETIMLPMIIPFRPLNIFVRVAYNGARLSAVQEFGMLQPHSVTEAK